MPTFDYQCRSCGKTYDVFHKVREVVDDVVCPACSSTEHIRLISAPNVTVGGSSYSSSSSDWSSTAGDSCAGGCCGGACNVN